MFGFNLMDKLYPVNDFLGSIMGGLNLDPETYNLQELIDTMKKTEQCEINNTSMKLDFLNKKFQNNFQFIIKSIKFGNIFFKFPKSYMVNNTIIKMKDICIDIQNNNLINVEEEKKELENKEESSSSSNLLSSFGTLINLVAVHVILEFNNIKL